MEGFRTGHGEGVPGECEWIVFVSCRRARASVTTAIALEQAARGPIRDTELTWFHRLQRSSVSRSA